MDRQAVMRLIHRKEEIESEIKQLGEILESQRNVGMHVSLVDSEGYPRMDIDIYQVRHARHRIICLQNDHKSIMKEIEDCLHAIHAQEKSNPSKSSVPTDNEMMDIEYNDNQLSFAKIDKVMKNSPAELAGFLAGDQIVQFGSISSQNFRNLQDISNVVQHSVGKSIHVTIKRDDVTKYLTIIPSTWSGRGLLGCNLLPI